MFTTRNWRAEWFGNVRGDLLSGLVVALAGFILFMTARWLIARGRKARR